MPRIGVSAAEATPADKESNSYVQSPYEAVTADSEYLDIPGDQGRLTCDAWRSTKMKESGNTLKWEYQVSAKYRGDRLM